jgi:uncharacterized protein YndB with AHSA1/START domain
MAVDRVHQTVSRKIAAPAEEIFKVLTDPAMHLDIDGSGLLKDASGNPIISGTGDKFAIRMYNPLTAHYETLSEVVEYERDRRLAWEPTIISVTYPEDEGNVGVHLGQRWTYALEPIDSRTTLVKEIYSIDCTKMPEWLRIQLRNGEHFVEFMTKTLENLERQVISAQK